MFDEEKTRRKLIAKYLNKKRGFLKNLIYSILKHKGIYISRDAVIGEKAFFVHLYNIFIGKGVIIGDKCTIYHNVTIGAKDGEYPHIGNEVVIFCNSTVIGNITIGNSVKIAAGAVAVSSFGDNAIIGGVPARIIKK